MKRQSVILFTLFCLSFLIFAVHAGAFAEAIDVIRNGKFENGLEEWNLHPKLRATATWPLQEGKINLHPPSGCFYKGTIIYQNLNVTDIAGKEAQISCKLTKYYAPEGNTVAIYLKYVDTNGNVQRIKVLNPENKDISNDTLVTGTYTFPSNARKLVMMEIAKENYGEFLIDEISLIVDGQAGPVPKITTASVSASYGENVTIQGSNFGQNGSIMILSPLTGKPVYDPGIYDVSWSDNQITFKVREPGRSGRIVVVSDFVESNNDATFELKSPNFTIDFMEDEVTVYKGEKAEFVVKVDLLNGFETNGMGFMLQQPYDFNSITTFTPAPLKTSGGVLMTIDTKDLSEGTYNGVLQTLEDKSSARFASFKLNVKTVDRVRFKEQIGSTYPYEYQVIEEKNVTKQGSIGTILVDALDASGNVLSDAPIKLQSSDPEKLPVYESWGYSIFANESGDVTLNAIAPDGRTVVGSLPVHISIPDQPKVTYLNITPNPVTNKYTDNLTMTAHVTGTASSHGWRIEGNIEIKDDTRGWSSDYSSYSGTFKIDHSKTNLGDYLFTVSIGDSTRATILSVVNDPDYSALKPIVKSLDPDMPPYMQEQFMIELYDTSGNLAFSKEYFSSGLKGIVIGAITPGTYKVKIAPTGYYGVPPFEPQFYPNTKDISKAEPVQFEAGKTKELVFFLRKPQISGPEMEVEGVLNNLIQAYNSKNLELFMSYVSDNYMDRGQDKSALREELNSQFSDPSFTTIQIASKQILVTDDLATVTVTFTDNSTQILYFKKEGESWKLYGNQEKYEIHAYSMHFDNGYYVNFAIPDKDQNIRSVAVNGQGITGTLNLTYQAWGGWALSEGLFISQQTPTGTLTYSITITGKDNSQDTYQKTITGYVENFATNLSPQGTVTGQIVFSWTGIPNAHRYAIELYGAEGNRIWEKYDIPPSTTSVPYDGPSLSPGTYVFNIVSAIETQGVDNFSFARGQFTLQAQAEFYISGVVKKIDGSPISGVVVKARDYETSQIIASSTDNFGHFILYISNPGEYEIIVEKEGLEPLNPPNFPIGLNSENPHVELEDIVMVEKIPTPNLIVLTKGWNFVSFPKEPAQKTIENAFQGLLSKIRIIWSYDNEEKRWLRWKPEGGNTNSLSEIKAGPGYWIYMNEPSAIDISSWTEPQSKTIALFEGWNLVGWLGEEKSLSDALTGLNGQWIIIWSWDKGEWSAKHESKELPFPHVDKLYQGKAYWIKMKAGASWQQE